MKYIKSYQNYIKEDLNNFTFTESIKKGETSDAVKHLQENLNKLGFKLYIYGIDGICKDETMGTVTSLLNFVKEFPKYYTDEKILEIKNDEISLEQLNFIEELAKNNSFINDTEEYFKKMNVELGGDFLGKKEFIKNIPNPAEFMLKLNKICEDLKTNPNWMLLVMYKESGFNPSKPNPNGGAVGLIQFMPETAKGLNTSTEELKRMSAIEQLDYVYKFYKQFTGKLNSVQDLYLATFLPIMVGKNIDSDTVLKYKGISAQGLAQANPAIDLNKDNQITKGEFDEYVTKGIPSKYLS